jgi:hypothetical protein
VNLWSAKEFLYLALWLSAKRATEGPAAALCHEGHWMTRSCQGDHDTVD